MEPQKLGIVIALTPEARVLPGRRIKRFQENLTVKKGCLGSGKEFFCVISGMGKSAAEKGAACALSQHNISALLSIGVSGALDSSLKTGNIVLAQKIVTFKGETCLCDNSLNESIEKKLKNAGILFKKGVFVTSDEVLSDKASKIEAHTCTHALAVDMESIWVGLTAHKCHIPFTSLRVISDTRDQTIVVDAAELIDSRGRIVGKAVIKTLINQPSVVLCLPQMAFNFNRALKALQYAVKTL